MTYQIIITEETAANIVIDNNTTNVSITTNEYPITIEYNAVIEQAGGNAYGNANVAAYLASSSLTGNIITSANISGAYILGNGSQLTGLPATYGNANVAANLAAFGSNPISTSGNITGGYFAGNGSLLTNITAGNITGTVANAVYALNANAATYATNAVQAAVANVANSVAGANVSGTVANATYALNSNAATFAGTVTTAAQPNITSVGILTAINTSGNVSATGNITGNYFIGNGSLLTGIATSTYGNANVADFLANGFGSNTITTTGNITAGNINTANYVAFGTGGTFTTASPGQMFWDVAQQTVSLGMNNGVTQQIGLEQYVLVKASSAITDGQVVMFTGAAGDNVQAAPADTTSVGFRPEYIIGVATQSIALNAFGYITTFGTVNGLNTNAFTVGDILWVDNATPGALTATRPTDPNYQIEIAAVTKKAGGDGHIQVRVTPFNNLDSLTDVTITTPSTGQALVYSGNVWINGNPQQANIANVANSVAGANVSGTVANATYATSAGSATTANTANTANTVTDAAQGNITSVGTLTSLSVSGNVDAGNLRTTGQVTATGNINGGNLILPNGGRYYGDFTSGTASGRTAFQTTATGTSSATSLTAIPGVNHTTSNTAFSSQLNLFASTDVGNSSFSRMQQLGNRLVFGTSSTGTGTAGNIQIQAGSAQIWLLTTGNVGIGNSNPQHTLAVSGSAYIATDLSVIGNISSGGDFSTANLSVTNINPASTFGVTVNSEMFVYGNLLPFGNVLMQSDQVLYGETIQLSALGNGTGSLSAAGNITGGNINTGGVVSATGNILTGNLIITPGTGAGNIDLVSSQAMTTVTTTNNPGRIIMGSGYTGNADSWSVDYDPYTRMRQAGVLVNNRLTRGDGAINTTGLVNVFQQEFTANITTNSVRNFSAINFLHVGGGANGYQATPGSPATFVGMNSLVIAGTQGNVALGNTTLNTATGGIFGVNPQNGASIGNAFGVVGTMQPGGATGNIINAVAFTPWTVLTTGVAPTTLPTNYNVFYNPGTATTYGALSTINSFRSATNYYAFKNDDDVAQVKLGSLRSYNEFQYSTATSGTVNIDKNNAQVQFLNPTANVTIGDLQNFVTTASDSVNNDNQTDTVTLIIQQGATPYTVTMPTGNASIKYAGGVSTIGATANAVTMVSISAIRSAANATLYLASVSSEFS